MIPLMGYNGGDGTAYTIYSQLIVPSVEFEKQQAPEVAAKNL